MKIKKKVLDKINTPEKRTRIALALGQGEQSVAKMFRTNSENGPLTKIVALNAIRELTGLNNDDILEAKKEKIIK